jgi:hypothetical protein
MKYKDYIGHVVYDEEAKIFHGEIIGINDVVTFQSKTIEDLEDAFRGSVDDYLEFCRKCKGRDLTRQWPVEQLADEEAHGAEKLGHDDKGAVPGVSGGARGGDAVFFREAFDAKEARIEEQNEGRDQQHKPHYRPKGPQD